ncbi:hypothetical protein BC835DRAFT_751793 [Cytidiella melzeri]|nr:hypothetical protein BC835DRAFT_751793 [Cytidiella melzeri]
MSSGPRRDGTTLRCYGGIVPLQRSPAQLAAVGYQRSRSGQCFVVLYRRLVHSVHYPWRSLGCAMLSRHATPSTGSVVPLDFLGLPHRRNDSEFGTTSTVFLILPWTPAVTRDPSSWFLSSDSVSASCESRLVERCFEVRYSLSRTLSSEYYMLLASSRWSWTPPQHLTCLCS